MDFLPALVSGMTATFSVVGTGVSVGMWVANRLRQAAYERKGSEILALLDQLGCASEAQVRALVEQEFARVKTPPQVKEDAVNVLLNLTRGARFLTSQGRPRSSYLRCERLVDQLLSNLEPVCKAGDAVGPNWKLERFLGRGAFGEVWLARNPYFPLPRAYKMFVCEEAHAWLKKEQANLFKIKKDLGNQPNIVAFEDVALDGKQPYLALEYISGGSLEDWIVEDPADRSVLNKYEVMQGITRGLAEAHEKGIYHRDLKPANILLTEVPPVQAKISDFGLSTFDQNNRPSGQTSLAAQVGTPMYLPPEAQNVLAPRFPAQDDVFAVGVLWYQLLVERLERPPYDFGDQLREKGQDTHSIQLITRCLAQPQRRFKDAIELAAELDSAPFPALPPGLLNVEPLVREYLGTRLS